MKYPNEQDMFVASAPLSRVGLGSDICAGRALDMANRGRVCSPSMGDNGHEYAVCVYCQRDISHLYGWVRSPYTIRGKGTAARSRDVLGEKDLQEAAVNAELREKARTEALAADAREKAELEKEFEAALATKRARKQAKLDEEERVEVAEVASEGSEEDEVKVTETTADVDDSFSTIARYESQRDTDPIDLADDERQAMEDYINLDEDYMGALQLYFQMDGIAVDDDEEPPVAEVVVGDDEAVDDGVVGCHL